MVKRALLLLAACGDNIQPAPPGELTAGPVTIETADLSLTFGPLSIDHFLSIGSVADPDPTVFYTDATFASPTRGVSQEGDWLVLDDGTKIKLTECAFAQCAELDIDASAQPNAVFVRLTLPKTAGEPMYGTGDAAIHADVSGTTREMELRLDNASDSGLNETHVPVPLAMWPRENVAMFVADDRPGNMDLGATDPTRVVTTYALPARGAYKIFLYKAPTPVDLVRRYIVLTAPPAVPPKWAFAPQQWRNEWMDSAEMMSDATTMRSLHVPGSVMWIDNPWETAYNSFDVDTARFADAKQLITDLGAQGYKVIFWSTPYVNVDGPTASDHAEGIAHDYFVTGDAHHVLDYPWSSGPGALVDFTNPDATDWWRERIKKVVALGAAGFKLDYGEDMVPDVGGTVVAMLAMGGDNSVLHNRYAAGYHAAYGGTLAEPFLITRAGAWGEQATNTAIWPGDLSGNFDDHDAIKVGGLPSAISRGLSLSVSGYPFYGSDIGGFRGFPTTENLLRWAEYAAYGTIMQLGGGGDSHNPWDTALFDAGAADIYKTYAQEHIKLFPYLYTLALRAGVDGTPVTTPAKFLYDCACDDAMFLLGDLLIAPVIEAGATTRDVVLPPGNWVDPTGATMSGTLTVPAPLGTIPTWQRAGSLVARFAKDADTLLPATAAGVTSYADPTYGNELRVDYAPGGNASLKLHDNAMLSGAGDTVAITGGSNYTVATFAVPHAAITHVTTDDGTLPQGDVTSCAAPGCWSYANGKALVRIFATSGLTRSAQLH